MVDASRDLPKCRYIQVEFIFACNKSRPENKTY